MIYVLADLAGFEGFANLFRYITFRSGAAGRIQDVALVFKLHLTLGLTILLLFPFTRLVHMLSAPVRYIWRSGYQVVRSRKLAARHG